MFAIGDPLSVPGGVLQKVATLARSSNARIELFHALDESLPWVTEPARRGPLSPLRESERIVARARHRLERIARDARFRGCRLNIEVRWDRPPHEAIVRAALRSRADLVIASTHAHGRTGRLLLRNTDWELMRECPCPLLLVKSSRTHRQGSILITVDPFHAHAKPSHLDARLLESGEHLAALLRKPAHAFHAYMPLIPVGSPGEPMVWEDPAVERTHAAEVRAEFDRLAAKAGIPRARRHLVVGDVPSGLGATAARVRADVVVMGAVSRSGLRRLFIGSTAERVLDELRCDVLIVKPQGFRTRVPAR